jgi:stage II sporulation protein D
VDSDETYKFDDSKTFTKEDFINVVKSKYPNYDSNTDIKIESYTGSGRVDSISIGNIKILGTDARTLFGLRSTFFELKFENNSVIFNTKGYGHGVGMSQDGANQMAKEGKNYKEIIEHYYTNIKIEKIN